MKIRIQDHSVRFRITVREAETLWKVGWIESSAEMFSKETKQSCGKFIYGILKIDDAAESTCEMKPGSIKIILNLEDCKTLNAPSEEGIYIRQEIELESGKIHRFIAFVEKDRPATKCGKPDEWIYDRHKSQTVPIVKQQVLMSE